MECQAGPGCPCDEHRQMLSQAKALYYEQLNKGNPLTAYDALQETDPILPQTKNLDVTPNPTTCSSGSNEQVININYGKHNI